MEKYHRFESGQLDLNEMIIQKYEYLKGKTNDSSVLHLSIFVMLFLSLLQFQDVAKIYTEVYLSPPFISKGYLFSV